MSATVLDGWEAARVVRKHTMINIRAENNAEHTWGVVHILLCVHPAPEPRLIIAAQYHDTGEPATGDIPAKVKWDNPDIREVSDRLANQYVMTCLPTHLHVCLILSEAEEALIEFCDRAEFCFSTYYENMLGNRHVAVPFGRSYNKIKELHVKYADAWGSQLHPAIGKNTAALLQEVESMERKVTGI